MFAASCSVGCTFGSGLLWLWLWLWLWCRLAALILPLAQEISYATGAAPQNKKKKKKRICVSEGVFGTRKRSLFLLHLFLVLLSLFHPFFQSLFFPTFFFLFFPLSPFSLPFLILILHPGSHLSRKSTTGTLV